MIVIVDYGMGNLKSIQNMFKKVGVAVKIASSHDEIMTADKLILPGVGAFDNAMKNLNEMKLIPVLREKVLAEKTPTLGICLGMQLLTERSEEGTLPGLGWIKGETKRFAFTGENAKLRIPHMGWNTVEICKESKLFADMYDEPRYYFVHSFHVVCTDDSDSLCKTEYGYAFTSAVERGNIYGAQFHPEKSHKFGMKLLKNFAEL